MKKNIICAATIGLCTLFSANYLGNGTVDMYRRFCDHNGIGVVREYYANELTPEMIIRRGESVLIEKTVGVVIDDAGNGKLLDPANPKYDYISYRSVENAHKGDVILTVFIYEPGNAYVDDIADRFDYIIDNQ